MGNRVELGEAGARWVSRRFIVASWQKVAGDSRLLPIVRKKRDSSYARVHDQLVVRSKGLKARRTWKTSFRIVSTRFSSVGPFLASFEPSSFVPDVEAVGPSFARISFRRFTARPERGSASSWVRARGEGRTFLEERVVDREHVLGANVLGSVLLELRESVPDAAEGTGGG